ncbi:hypothetical protein BLNAU_10396 [Blattamonas nauphoetae]|uniref:Uncharacterized protein n=1 Tax=Blattamonas nauphoetae TaxID=2049346 RepID=A0ABQ9XTE2_9EUKA|nr:hypothetical protein BLNAU_10396 [Blattamonas nauphoetae]
MRSEEDKEQHEISSSKNEAENKVRTIVDSILREMGKTSRTPLFVFVAEDLPDHQIDSTHFASSIVPFLATASLETGNFSHLKTESIQRECTKLIRSQSVKPIQSNSAKPIQSNSAKPIQSNSAKPIQSNSAKPIQSNSAKPIQSNSAKPIQSNSAKPIQSNSAKPIQSNFAKPIPRQFSPEYTELIPHNFAELIQSLLNALISYETTQHIETSDRITSAGLDLLVLAYPELTTHSLVLPLTHLLMVYPSHRAGE